MEQEEEVQDELSISISPIDQQINQKVEMFTWVEFNLNESKEASYVQANKVMMQPNNGQEKINSKELHLPQENRLHQIADDIMCRYYQYGKLDSTQKIAKRTGASKRQELTEKDINYYDQDDPFIDDEEILEHNQGQKMFLPNVQFSDFNCVQGDLKILAQSQQHHERMELINSFSKTNRQEKEKISDSKPQQENKSATKNPEKKHKRIKPNNQPVQKSQNQLTTQDSLFLQDLFATMGNKKEEAKKNPNKKVQKKTDKSTNKQPNQVVPLYQKVSKQQIQTSQQLTSVEQVILKQPQSISGHYMISNDALSLPHFQDEKDLSLMLSSMAQQQLMFQQFKKGGQMQEAIQIDDEEENHLYPL